MKGSGTRNNNTWEQVVSASETGQGLSKEKEGGGSGGAEEGGIWEELGSREPRETGLLGNRGI